MNYTYILKCNDDTLYTGWTTDVNRRVEQHNNGTASKYTRARLPVKLVYFETFETRSDAMKREYEIKTYTREDKLKLIGKK